MNKQDEILQFLNRTRFNEEAVNVERVYFYKTDKKVNPKQEESFHFFSGTLPVLLLAPHAVRYYRQKKVKASDQFTGSIVYLLNQLVACPAIAATKLYGGDPEIDNPCFFKAKIYDICWPKTIKIVLDIHGAARDRDFDVNLGARGGETLLGKIGIQDTIERNLQDFGIRKISYHKSSDIAPYSIVPYVARELGIPAVQLEINKQYRVPGQNPQGFHRLLGALMESIKELGS